MNLAKVDITHNQLMMSYDECQQIPKLNVRHL